MRAHILTLLLAYVSTAVLASELADRSNDTAHNNGNYQTLYCGSGQHRYQGKKLNFLLPLMQKKLQAVLDDIELGTASKHGFRSFFKTNKYQPHVRSVFQSMAEARNVTRGTGWRGELTSENLPQPTLVCVNSDNSAVRVWHDTLCSKGEIAQYNHLTNFVLLCPAFWNLRARVTDASCPTLVGPRRRQRLEPNDDSLGWSQFGALVHELAHLYNPLESTHEEEKRLIQDLVDLDAEGSVLNAQNYATYASAVVAGCRSWPMAPTRRNDGVEL